MSIRGQPHGSSTPMGPTPHSSPPTAPLRDASLVAGPRAGCHPRPREKRPGPRLRQPGAQRLAPGLARPRPTLLAPSPVPNCALPRSLTTAARTRSRCTALLSSASLLVKHGACGCSRGPLMTREIKSKTRSSWLDAVVSWAQGLLPGELRYQQRQDLGPSQGRNQA